MNALKRYYCASCAAEVSDPTHTLCDRCVAREAEWARTCPATPPAAVTHDRGPPRDTEGRPVAPGLYWWVRDVDETGMSGPGRVAQVAVFEDGSAVLRWLAHRNTSGVGSSVFYDRLHDLMFIHGHGARRTGRLEAV